MDVGASPSADDSFDFCRFAHVDAIADVPIPQLFPLIYGAYGPGTKVILTMRNASEWVQRRDQWTSNGQFGISDVAPMGAGLASSIANASKVVSSPMC